MGKGVVFVLSLILSVFSASDVQAQQSYVGLISAEYSHFGGLPGDPNPAYTEVVFVGTAKSFDPWGSLVKMYVSTDSGVTWSHIPGSGATSFAPGPNPDPTEHELDMFQIIDYAPGVLIKIEVIDLTSGTAYDFFFTPTTDI